MEAAKLKKKQAAAKKAEPIEQAKVYIRRLPLDITETTRLMIQINSQKCVPKNLAAEYLKMFTEHNKKMQKAVTELQTWLASPNQTDGAKVIQGINKSVAKFKTDKKTWDGLYSQHAKPTGDAQRKAKAKAA